MPFWLAVGSPPPLLEEGPPPRVVIAAEDMFVAASGRNHRRCVTWTRTQVCETVGGEAVCPLLGTSLS
jgi:hypothetical protein